MYLAQLDAGNGLEKAIETAVEYASLLPPMDRKSPIVLPGQCDGGIHGSHAITEPAVGYQVNVHGGV